MTSHEAIWRIKLHNEIHSRKEPNAIYITEALQMAIDALEKQTHKKPVVCNEWFECEANCPSCGVFLGFSNNEFCSRCGQAIDWSE